MKKFTLATAKSFIKKNRDSLLVKVSSDFDGMTDGETLVGFSCNNCCGSWSVSI